MRWLKNKRESRGSQQGRLRGRRLRLESLEDRYLLATASALTGSLHYDAEAGEVNDVVLSPGHFFSIQDAADVALSASGGCALSEYLSNIGISVDVSVGGSFGVGSEVSWGVGIGIGVPLIPMDLPDGVICPSPASLSTSPGITDALQQTFSTETRGVASAVAGAAVTQNGSVYFKVNASAGTVDEYCLYQAIVDPATAISETEANNKFSQADAMTVNTLVRGDFSAGDDDVDFYKFSAISGERLALVLDNDPDKDSSYSNTRITLYGPDGSELASNVSFSDGSATAAVEANQTGIYYVSVADNGYGDDNDYQFVVVKAQNGVNEDTTKVKTFSSGTLNQAIPDQGSTTATLNVDVGDAFAKAANMEVTLNINHTYDGDLRVVLESPSGTLVTLVDNCGGAGDNFTNTVLSDSGATSILAGSAPFTGTYRPLSALSGFSSDLANGDWKLHVYDETMGDVGSLVSWALKFNVKTNSEAADADPLTSLQYAKGKVSSEYDDDWFKVSSASVQAGQLVFAFVDTADTDGENADENDSYLTVYAADGSSVLGEDDDDGPMISAMGFDSFTKDLENAGVDIDMLSSFSGSLVVSVDDGNDRVDASKVNVNGQKIEINGGTGDDVILGPGGDTVHLNGDEGNDTFVFNNTAPATVTLSGDDGSDALQINGTDANDTIIITLDGTDLLVSVDGIVARYRNIATSSVEGLGIAAGDGDDTIVVDISGGLLTFSQGIGVDGGAGQDLLTVFGTTAPESDEWVIGAVAGVGTNTITAGGKTQNIAFEGLDPVLTAGVDDEVPGPLTVIVPASNNAITLSSGSGSASALLSVDNLASLQFAGKTAVTIDAGAGSDTVYLAQGAKKGFQSGAVTLTVLGNTGDDTITTESALGASVGITLKGDAGDDTLGGSAGNDTFVGGAGNDTIVLAGGADTVNGGDDFDTILVQGTSANDTISASQTGADTLVVNLNGSLQTATFQAVEAVDLEAGAGQDLLTISVADSLVATPAASLRFIARGNDVNVTDRLVVRDEGLGDVTILRQAADGCSGSVTVGPLAAITYEGIDRVDVTPVDSVTDGYGADGLGRLVVLQADPFEANNSRRVATAVDDVARTEVDPSIDPAAVGASNGSAGTAADEDWYCYTAPHTGTMQFLLRFETIGTLANGRAGLPGDGQLEINVYDASGTLIAKAAGEGDASHTIGVAGGGVYYVRVQGVSAEVVNRYDLTVNKVDVYGPQVTDVSITGSPTYDLFSHEDSVAQTAVPTPLVHSLTIDFQDYVARWPGYLYAALDPTTAGNAGNYQLVGDSVGTIPIVKVEVLNEAAVLAHTALAQVRVIFDPALVTAGAEVYTLPDDRYTLTISAGVVDPAGNALDGESNADEPHANPTFPSGDSVAGGDFVVRFTIDSRPEIGVWDAGSVYLDTNGNLTYDPTNTDAVNRDISYVLGYTSDYIFSGNFTDAADGTADGFQKLAAYGDDGSRYRWLIDTDNDGVPNLTIEDAAAIIGTPIAGNFDGNAANGDEVGLFDGTTWYLDGNHDYQVTGSSADLRITSTLQGIPVVGDFDGDGLFDLATWSNNQFYFDLAANGYGGQDATIDAVSSFGFLGATTYPVAADMDQDGISDVGIWVPNRSGADAEQTGEWYFLVSDDLAGTRRVTGSVSTLAHSFTSGPVGADLFGRFGNEYAMPLLGNFCATLPESDIVDPIEPHDYDSVALYDSATSTFYLRALNRSGPADATFAYGAAGAGWITLVGDWNGDGTSGVGLFDPNTSTFYLTSAYTSGSAQYTFGYGIPNAGWVPLVGDWDGNGTSGVGLYDPNTSTFYLTNTLSTGGAEYTFCYGVPQGGWTPIVGDWNGDGVTGVGLYDPGTSTFYLTNTLRTGIAEQTFGYGIPNGGWTPLVGDWDGDGAAGVGLFAPDTSTFYLTNSFTTGVARYTFGYGAPNAGWTALVGDWDGNGTTGVGLYDPTHSTFYLTNTLDTGVAEYTVDFGTPSSTLQPLVGCWNTSSSSSAAAAVDQLDLAALAADELDPAATLDSLDILANL
jgi:subtilisin-like proprotein convertase family protein